jgi:hypothetical protein
LEHLSPPEGLRPPEPLAVVVNILVLDIRF